MEYNRNQLDKNLSLPLVSIGLILGYFVSQALCFIIAGKITGLHPTNMSSATIFISISANATLWIIITSVINLKLDLPKFDSKHIKEHFITYLSGVGLLYLIMFFLGLLFHYTGFKPQTQNVAEQVKLMGQTSIFLVILGPAILIPAVEELLFRGLLYRSIKRSLSPLIAAIISATLFGLAHMEPDTMPQLIIIGLILTYVYEKSGSIYVPIALHATNNFISVMVLVHGKEIEAFLKSLTQAG